MVVAFFDGFHESGGIEQLRADLELVVNPRAEVFAGVGEGFAELEEGDIVPMFSAGTVLRLVVSN